jgi:hypothetical protein
MAAALPEIVRAGRMLRLLGWVTLGFGVVAELTFGLGPDTPGRGLASNLALAFAVVMYAATCLLIGAALKRGDPWAKFAGLGLSLCSLPFFPFGTLCGLAALVYLVRGWAEDAEI